MNLEKEVLFSKSSFRHNLFPITHGELWKLRQKQVASHWVYEEIDHRGDVGDFNNKLNEQERDYIKKVLSFFTTVDSVLLSELGDSVLSKLMIPEAKSMVFQMEAMEDIHNQSYSQMVDSLIKESDRQEIYDAVVYEPKVKAKADFAHEYIASENPAESIVGIAILEQMHISCSFTSFYWLKSKGLMNGFTSINVFAARDEAIHGEFAVLLYSMLSDELKLSTDEISKIVRRGAEVEKMFTDWILPTKLMGINKELMYQYIEFISDQLLISLGYPPIFNGNISSASNPLPFMQTIGLDLKTNFFEKRSAEYKRNVVDQELDFNASF